MATQSRSLVIYRNKGTMIPDGYLVKAIAAYPNWCGIAIADKDGLITSPSHVPASIAGMKELMTGDDYKDCDIIFCLGKEADGKQLSENHSNLQPFEIVLSGEGEDAEPMVVAFVDGDLNTYASSTNPEGRPYLFVTEYLGPKLREIYEDVGEDDQKFADKLARPTLEKEILATGLADGSQEFTCAVLTVAPKKGFRTFSQTKKSEDFSWGFVTDTCGYVESDGGGTSAPATGGDGNADGNKSEAGAGVVHEVRPPANVISNEVLRQGWAKLHGKPNPTGWKNRAWHTCLPNMVGEAKAMGWEVKSIAGTQPVTQPKASVPATSAKETAIAFVKTIDVSTREVMSPDQMKKNEAARPTFFDKTGMKLEDFMKWEHKDRVNLVRKLATGGEDSYELIGGLLDDLTYAVYSALQDLEVATAPKAEPVVAPKVRRRVSIS